MELGAAKGEEPGQTKQVGEQQNDSDSAVRGWVDHEETKVEHDILDEPRDCEAVDREHEPKAGSERDDANHELWETTMMDQGSEANATLQILRDGRDA